MTSLLAAGHPDCLLPSFLPPSSPSQLLFQADHFSSAVSVSLSSQRTPRLSVHHRTAPPLSALGPCSLRAPAGLQILHSSTMRSLMDSSWMKFGPAGRDSLDWSPGPSALPSTDRLPVSLFKSNRCVGTIVY